MNTQLKFVLSWTAVFYLTATATTLDWGWISYINEWRSDARFLFFGVYLGLGTIITFLIGGKEK